MLMYIWACGREGAEVTLPGSPWQPRTAAQTRRPRFPLWASQAGKQEASIPKAPKVQWRWLWVALLLSDS